MELFELLKKIENTIIVEDAYECEILRLQGPHLSNEINEMVENVLRIYNEEE